VKSLAQTYQLTQLEAICNSTRSFTIIPPSTLNSDLKFCVNNRLFSDLTFEVEGRQYFAHKAVICARSEYFRRYKMKQMKDKRN